MASAVIEERVILVDRNDVEVGTAEKLSAHRDALLHRAVSVVLFDARGSLLLQRRAATKYHSPGLWSNTACGHPRPGETALHAARRRLADEMGIDCALSPAFAFTYRAELGGGLVEHELDHVFVGRCAAAPRPDPAEVAEWRWEPLDHLRHAVARTPSAYTAWLPRILDELVARGIRSAA